MSKTSRLRGKLHDQRNLNFLESLFRKSLDFQSLLHEVPLTVKSHQSWENLEDLRLQPNQNKSLKQRRKIAPNSKQTHPLKSSPASGYNHGFK